MPPSFFVLFLLIPLLQHTLATTTESTYIAGTQCTFFYKPQGPLSIPPFTFDNCTLSAQTSYTTWSDCLTMCCPTMPAGDYSSPLYHTIQICKTNNGLQMPTNVILLVMTMIMVLVGLVLVLCFCAVVCRVCKYLRKNGQVRNQLVEITKVEWNDQKQINDRMDVQLKWSEMAKKHKTLQNIDSPCSICLEQNTTAELYCKHQYHPTCIGSWLAKNSCCPCCRRDNILGAKVYCSICRWQYMVCSRNLLILNSRQIPLICQKCREEKNKEGSLQEMVPPKMQSGQFVFDFDSYQKNSENAGHGSHAMLMENIEEEVFN